MKTRTSQNRLRKRDERYVEQYGSASPLIDFYERERLNKYIPMSFKIAARFPTNVLTYEERQQVAFVGICAAMRSFNNKSDEAYWAWRKGCYAVQEAIRTEINRQCRNPQLAEMESCPDDGDDEFGKNPLEAQIEREENEARQKLIRKMRRAINKLPERLREIMIRVALKGESQIQVAQELGLSQGWVSRLYAQGLEELREKMGVAPKA